MKTLFIATIIGDGTDSGGDFRPATSDYPVGAAGEIPWDDAANRPLNTWTVVEVSTGDTAAFAGDARIDALPVCALETPVAQIDPAQLAGMRAALTRRGIGVAVDSEPTFGSIVAAIKRRAGEGRVTPTKTQLTL